MWGPCFSQLPIGTSTTSVTSSQRLTSTQGSSSRSWRRSCGTVASLQRPPEERAAPSYQEGVQCERRMTNYIALAIPFFFLLMGVELWVAGRRGARVYRFNDALVDLSCGMTQQVLLVFAVGLLGACYLWLYQHRFWSLHGPAAWLVAFFAVDFIYYWWHRLSHRVNFLWAVHVVHHQSEDYNLAVALRQAVLSVWTIWPFHLSLALIGVPPVVFATVESFSTLYQFWIHTELVGKLGWYERAFNTPSQHRVHHAINPRYLDRNYAATLCIWDRLFGTFQEEREQTVFGLVKPLASFNPLWAQLQAWAALWRTSRGARGVPGSEPDPGHRRNDLASLHRVHAFRSVADRACLAGAAHSARLGRADGAAPLGSGGGAGTARVRGMRSGRLAARRARRGGGPRGGRRPGARPMVPARPRGRTKSAATRRDSHVTGIYWAAPPPSKEASTAAMRQPVSGSTSTADTLAHGRGRYSMW